MGEEKGPFIERLQEGQRDASQKARLHSEPTTEPPEEVRPRPTTDSVDQDQANSETPAED